MSSLSYLTSIFNWFYPEHPLEHCSSIQRWKWWPIKCEQPWQYIFVPDQGLNVLCQDNKCKNWYIKFQHLVFKNGEIVMVSVNLISCFINSPCTSAGVGCIQFDSIYFLFQLQVFVVGIRSTSKSVLDIKVNKEIFSFCGP